MLDELRRMPRKQKSLAESRRDFEIDRAAKSYDPIADDPVQKSFALKLGGARPCLNFPEHFTGPFAGAKDLRVETGELQTFSERGAGAGHAPSRDAAQAADPEPRQPEAAALEGSVRRRALLNCVFFCTPSSSS